MLEASDGEDLQRSMTELCELLDKWPAALLPVHHSPELRCLRFQLISCALCSLHVLLRLPRQGYPYKLFQALKGPQGVSAALDSPSCMRDGLADLILTAYDSWQQPETPVPPLFLLSDLTFLS